MILRSTYELKDMLQQWMTEARQIVYISKIYFSATKHIFIISSLALCTYKNDKILKKV